jgi:hypothetical protein
MENTAIEELQNKGIKDVIIFQSETKRIWLSDLIQEQKEQLQAKHEEELKQAVVKAWDAGAEYNGDIMTSSYLGLPDTAIQYYKANFKTKEL